MICRLFSNEKKNLQTHIDSDPAVPLPLLSLICSLGGQKKVNWGAIWFLHLKKWQRDGENISVCFVSFKERSLSETYHVKMTAHFGWKLYFKGMHFYSTASFLCTPFSFTHVNTMLTDTSLSSLLSWVSKHSLKQNHRCHLSSSPQFLGGEVECRHAVPHSVLIKKLPLTNEQFDSHTCCLSADLRGDLSLTARVIWERSSPCRSNKPPLLLTQVSFSHFSSSLVPSVLLFSSTISFC